MGSVSTEAVWLLMGLEWRYLGGVAMETKGSDALAAYAKVLLSDIQ